MDRNWLNERLLTEAERLENVDVVFEHKLFKCDVVKGVLTFLVNGKETNVTSDIIIGADGVYSQVRTSLMRAIKYDSHILWLIKEWISHKFTLIVCGVNWKFLLQIVQLNGMDSK